MLNLPRASTREVYAMKQSDELPKELPDLIRIMLRVRPDRIWVGELRDAKAVDSWVSATRL
nr:Flp pilus assembly complex ATPase component TadA [Pseudomonas aeruginosa]